MPALCAAAALSAALILLVGRHLTFYNLDELMIFERGGWNSQWLFEPFLAQLMVGTRVVFQIALDLDGDYAVVREVGALAAVLPSILFFFVARRRVGPSAALAFALPLLFLGSAWEFMLWPFQAISIGLALSAGLAAFLLLERDDRIGDAGACVALTAAIATFGLGLAFLVAVGASILSRADRWRRVWIVAIPLALYIAWWLWRVHFQDGQVELKSVLLVVPYIATSLYSALTGLAGLNFDFMSSPEFNVPPVSNTSWGPVLAVAALGALAYRIRRGSVPRGLWIALVLVLAYWTSGALVVGDLPNFRYPGVSRYLFPSAVMLLLVAVWALDGWRPSRNVAIALFVAAGLAISGNLAQGRSGLTYLEAYADNAKAQLAMIELARDRVDPDFIPPYQAPEVSQIQLMVGAGGYLRGMERYGSPAYSIDELAQRSEAVRHGADDVLARAERLRLERAPAAPGGTCRTVRPAPGGGAQPVRMPANGAVISGAQIAKVGLRRFADRAAVPIGTVAAHAPTELRLYPDAAAQPWIGTIESQGPVDVCTRGPRA